MTHSRYTSYDSPVRVIGPAQRPLPTQQKIIQAPAGFEPTNPASNGPQTYAFDHIGWARNTVHQAVRNKWVFMSPFDVKRSTDLYREGGGGELFKMKRNTVNASYAMQQWEIEVKHANLSVCSSWNPIQKCNTTVSILSPIARPRTSFSKSDLSVTY
jgi:hypothetical protein